MKMENSNQANKCLPDCLVIGPQKAGTTWIHQYLESRGDVGLPQGVKETFFFDRRYQRGIGWYSRHFQEADNKQRIAEVAPSYFHCTEAPTLIAQNLGSIPLICTLRHPAKRAFSLYLHLRRFGKTRGPFVEAVKQHPAILSSSRYFTNLSHWMDAFGKNKIHVLFLEDLAKDADSFTRQLCRHLDLPFLGLDPARNQRVNEAALSPNPHLAWCVKGLADLSRSFGLYGMIGIAKKVGLKEVIFGRPGKAELPKLSREDCIWFTAQLEQEIANLENLLGVDLAHWRDVA